MWLTMSKIGKKTIQIPSGVNIDVNDTLIKVSWPKGNLEVQRVPGITLKIEDNVIVFECDSDDNKKYRGLLRTLVSNAVVWVTTGYEKKLMVIWVWYNVKLQWQAFLFNLWLSHPVNFPIPAWINASVEKDPKWNDIITLSSIDKQLLWEFAANTRGLKKPEPYKGKWIRYSDEVIKLKAWKTAKK